mgnify:CR=1 FL=1
MEKKAEAEKAAASITTAAAKDMKRKREATAITAAVAKEYKKVDTVLEKKAKEKK